MDDYQKALHDMRYWRRRAIKAEDELDKLRRKIEQGGQAGSAIQDEWATGGDGPVTNPVLQGGHDDDLGSRREEEGL